MYPKIGVGGSTADKSGVHEVDSCAAQMSLKQHSRPFVQSNKRSNYQLAMNILVIPDLTARDSSGVFRGGLRGLRHPPPIQE